MPEASSSSAREESKRLIADAVRAATDAMANTPPLPDRVAGYEILSLLGAGGMGIVYRARQRMPDRVVALKVLNPSAMSSDRVRRFANEAEFLGRLRHPGIAQVFDAGIADTPAGRSPYLTMELIEGACPITRYAREHDLGLEPRLRLLVDVCDALEHAHQKGLIHRDIKPANVVVDQSGRVKILDFGVARDAADHPLPSGTIEGRIVGTLPYMSPEQASGLTEDVDTRSDVYALGVLAYKLLTGRMPYDVEGRSPLEAIRIICEQAPAGVGAIDRSLRGDAETIVMKALEKSPSRRYQSAAALREDLGRFLDRRPLLARPPSVAYQLSKFARRNQAGVIGALAVLVVLAIGAGSTAWQAAEVRREADAGLGLLRMFLESHSRVEPDWAADPHNAALLRRLSDSAKDLLRDDPALEANLRDAFGYVYLQIGDTAQGEREYRRLLGLQKRLHGEDGGPTLRAYDVLIDAMLAGDRLEQALPTIELALQAAGFGEGVVDGATTHPESYAQALRALRLRHKLGSTLHALGRFDEAEATYRQTLDSLAGVLALTPFEPREHQNVAEVRHDLAVLLMEKAWLEGDPSRCAEAAALLRDAAAYHTKASYGGREHLTAQLSLARALTLSGNGDEAFKVFEGCDQLIERAPSPLAAAVAPLRWQTLATLHQRDDPPLAASCWSEASRSLENAPGVAWKRALVRARHGEFLQAIGEHAPAEAVLESSYRILRQRFDAEDPRVRRIASRLTRQAGG